MPHWHQLVPLGFPIQMEAECPCPCSVSICVQMKMYRKVMRHKSAPDTQTGLSRSVLPSLPEWADRHRLCQVSEEGLMVLRSQLHCCAFSWLTGILALSHIPLVYLQFQLQMLWVVLDKLEFMLMVSSLKWPACLHAFCLRVFTKTLKTAPFLCKHRLEVNSKWRGVDTFRARLQWEARVTAKYPGCPFFRDGVWKTFLCLPQKQDSVAALFKAHLS